MNWRSTLAAVFVAMGVTSTVSAATLTIDNGLLIGARNVIVNGTAYDVSFVTGSCQSVFSGCDSLSDFMFPTSSRSFLASQALLAQVLIDAPEGNFNTNPSLTFGCGAGSYCDVLTLWTVSGYTVGASGPQNTAGTDPIYNQFIANYTGLEPNQVWAKWSLSPPEPAAVPEPATLTLLGLGLIGATASRRLRKKA